MVTSSIGPGNALLLEIGTAEITGVFTGYGDRGRTAEEVAREAIAAAKRWLAAEVPVDEHLADQLLLPMALTCGGSFRTTEPSSHTRTNIEIIQRFLPLTFRVERENDLAWQITVEVNGVEQSNVLSRKGK